MLIVLTTLLSLLVWLFVVTQESSFITVSTQAFKLKDYSGLTGLWLPNIPNEFKAAGGGFQDWFTEARIELRPEDLTLFIARNNLVFVGLDDLPESAYNLEWFSFDGKLEHYRSENGVTTATGFHPEVWLVRFGESATLFIQAFDT